MRIQIVSATGTGPTKLAAFDAALRAAGIANYNLLTLSSVIPPAARVDEVSASELQLTGRWGDRMYVVMAHQETDRPGQEAWAGIGWVQNPDTLQGLFVEHEGHSRDEVSGDIAASLGSLVAVRPSVPFEAAQMKLRGVRCDSEPVCALVVAVYETASWETADLCAPIIG